MQDYLLKLQADISLTREEAALSFKEMFESDIGDQEIADFITLLSKHNLNSQELCGFLDYLSSQSRICQLEDLDIFDVCGTGGDGKNTINISTLSAFVLAALGEKVAKHGNYSASSTIGSSNLLEALNVPLIDSADRAKIIFDKTGLVFLHAPLWHPKLKRVAAIRKALGIRTVFNLLGPLLNPVKPKFQLIGTASEQNARLLSDTLSIRAQSRNFAVLYDRKGYDEVSLTGEAFIFSRDAQEVLSPVSFGVQIVDPKCLNLPGTLEEVVQVSIDLLSGKGKEEHSSVVAANVATALKLKYMQASYRDLYNKALDCIKSGAPLSVLKSVRDLR